METRDASCSCGQLRLEAAGDPVRVSVCHCLACQRRTGSAFAVQARFSSEVVRVVGRSSEYVRLSDETHEARVFRFCPECGATVFYTTGKEPDLIAVPVGGFADPTFPSPTISFYESRRHSWVDLPGDVERDVWAALRPLYESGRFAEVADRGRALLEAHPESAELLYNVACCESLAGRTDDALEHLRQAIDRSEELRALAADDPDLEPVRDERAFRQLIE